MMKNTVIAFGLMTIATSSMAYDPLEPASGALGDALESAAVATTYTYATIDPDDRANRLFVKTPFDFTLSANVSVAAGEDADSRFMIVAAGNDKGRNLYVGHSNGGSVTACGDPLTATDVKDGKLPMKDLLDRVDFDDESGCNPQ